VLMLDEHAHLSAEPAGAVPVAAMLSDALRDELPSTGPIVAVISGGNMDTFEKTRYVRRALAAENRNVRIRVRMPDRCGGSPRLMAELFGLLADQDVNVLDIDYHRNTLDLPFGVVEVALLLETRGAENADAVSTSLAGAGFQLA
jgi:threonine dehydratase